MINVFISKFANEGILRVIEAMYEYLPQFGIKPTEDINEAHIINNHGGALHKAKGIPSVASNHGLYWSRQPWGHDFQDVNKLLTDVMASAVAHTVPSDWVNRAVRRGGFWYPETIYHGIDSSKFVPQKENDGYVLWNKARADFVSDPNDVMRIASMMQNRQFYSTIGHVSPNLKILNSSANKAMPHAKMKEVTSRAGVYLATTRETFGIATLEAMAYGVPVAGWDWGGQSEIIIQGETGYLAPPGNWEALRECIERCFDERERLSANAIQDIKTRWNWKPRIEQYADIFKRVYAGHYATNLPKVSVIVTAYRLDEFLPACLDSILRQTFKDFECIVVDDANLDSTRMIVGAYTKVDKRVVYQPTITNRGLSGARNIGLQVSKGKFIRHVDADDFLPENALALEVTALEDEKEISHVVYGHLEVVRTDGSRVMEGSEPVRSGWPEPEFKWNYQMAHLNQLPSTVMVKREVYELSGGYRERMKRNEDAEFWCRVSSLGFRIRKFTQAVTLFHRERANSKGATEWATQGKEPDWTAWFPWRWGGVDFQSGWDAIRSRGDAPKNAHLVPFGAQGTPPKPLHFWYVHDYAYPVVSIVVTVGPGHEQYVIDALDSIQAQTYPDWECILVNDTGEKWDKDFMGAPWAKVVNMEGNQGVSAARNEGFKHIKGKYVIWMDADDYWLPWYLERMMLYAEKNSGVIFSDLLKEETEDGGYEVYQYRDFVSENVPIFMQYPGSSILVPREIAQAMVEYQSGFRVDFPGQEDWNYQMGVHHLGFCAFRIPEPLFVYRMYSTTKRETDRDKIELIREKMAEQYPQYMKGEVKLMCGCQGTKPPITQNPASLLSSSGNFENNEIHIDPSNPNQMVMVEYMGDYESYPIGSRQNRGVTYRFGKQETNSRRAIFVNDLKFLLSLNTGGEPLFRVIGQVAQPENFNPVLALGKPIVA